MRFLTIMLLLAGTAFAQTKCTSCKTEEPTSYTITKLTDCEKEKLAAAKAKLEAVTEDILEAHGKPQYFGLNTLTGMFGANGCPYKYPIHTFEIIQGDSYIVEVKDTIVINCNGSSGSIIIH